MTQSILILGGYGNFGKRISVSLARCGLPIVIAGRDIEKAKELKSEITRSKVEICAFDVNKDLAKQLKVLKPSVVINTCGPFQNSDYSVAETCIKHKVHYIDLSDGRDFVNGITSLDKQAKDNKVLVVSGASTVPGLSSAVLERYKSEFSMIDSLVFGISPGAKAPRGLATTKAIMTYLGKPLKPYQGSKGQPYGWQDIYRQEYPELGKRWMANCDIPDLDLLPTRYGIKSIRFSAGMESSMLHLSVWLISWAVRFGAPLNLAKHAKALLRLSKCFDWLGTPDGGMHILMRGKDSRGADKEIKWFLIAKDGDGPQVPCIPAIVLAKNLVVGKMKKRGAMPCLGMITLNEYMNELKDFAVTQHVIKNTL